MFLNRICLIGLFSIIALNVAGQTLQGTIHGIVSADGKPLPFANVGLKGTAFGTMTDDAGRFEITGVPIGLYELQVAFLGYKTWSKEVMVDKRNLRISLHPSLVKTTLQLDELVITGTRSEKRRLDSAVPVNVLDSRILQSTQSLTLAEGLSFQPGIRIEKDCQTCNYTQVRMNGLGGSYTQVLLNSKPLFSSLAGLYGLEQLPASMIDRVEIVRGGGSVLYGSNAIAGTINIITRDPQESSFGVSSTMSWVDGTSTDLQTDLNATLVSKSKKAGGTIMVSQRNREGWDANGDGFTELSEIENLSFGLSSFVRTSGASKLRLSLNSINEIRNGGDQLEREPHLRMQSEFRDSKIVAGNLDYSYDIYGLRSRIDLFVGTQITLREHYTGSFGADGYGESDNQTLVGGVQLNHKLLNFIRGSNLITVGFDYQQEDVKDEIKAYNYLVDQETFQSGVFIQSDWDLHPKINLVTGARLSYHNKTSKPFTTPRINFLYKVNTKTQLRLSYASGFRAPQAFDSDMHIAFSGGGVAITRIDPALRPEKSKSYTASIDYNYPHKKYIYGFTVTGFLTSLENTFILVASPPDGTGNTFLLRTNGSDAQVKGITVESRANYNYRIEIDLGWTMQSSRYAKATAWSENSAPSKSFLRTPGYYGYFALNYLVLKNLKTSLSGVHTGKMTVLHLAGAPGIEEDKLVETAQFLELNFKMEYRLRMKKSRINLFLNGGIQNFTNAYQADFDKGPNRDSNYIYGPGRPRTYFAGIRLESGRNE